MKTPRKATLFAAILVALFLLGMGAWIGVGIASISGVATPDYTVASTHEGYEIREYAPQLVARVEVEGSFEESMNRGFRKLAGYIFGDNVAPESAGGEASQPIAMTAPVLEQRSDSTAIAMTAPVTESISETGKRQVTFVMPKEYTLTTIPRPKNPEVQLVEIPARRYAVLRFSGWVNAEKSEAMKARLLKYLKRDGKTAAGTPALAQYNPPWTPPFMRRNEILVPLS